MIGPILHALRTALYGASESYKQAQSSKAARAEQQAFVNRLSPGMSQNVSGPPSSVASTEPRRAALRTTCEACGHQFSVGAGVIEVACPKCSERLRLAD